MTPCVKRYYFLYFSHPHPPLFPCPRPFAGAASCVRCQARGSVPVAQYRTVTSRHTTARQTSVREEGNRSAEEWNSFKFITGYTKITEEHPLLLFCFVFVFFQSICELFYLPCVVIKASCSPPQTPGREEARATLGVMF